MSIYSLNNKENYKNNNLFSINDVLNKYNLLIYDYLKFIKEKTKSISYNKFIIERGLETITHVFNLILYYSNNLDMSYYHSQKSYYFYIEFVEQIRGDQNIFLKLNTKDACMFVYKKTIFEIPSDIKIYYDDSICEILNNYQIIIKLLISKMNENQLKTIENICNEFIKKINGELLNIIKKMIYEIHDIELIYSFIKKYRKKY